jgi:hypothetical protein
VDRRRQLLEMRSAGCWSASCRSWADSRTSGSPRWWAWHR